MKLPTCLILAVGLRASAFATTTTVVIPADPSFQFKTEREYGTLSKLTRTDGKDSIGYSFVEKTEHSSIVISLGKDSLVRTAASIEAMGPGIKVEKRHVKIHNQDCDYLNWKMNGYFYGATHLKLDSHNKKKELITLDVVAASEEDLRQVEKDLSSLSDVETVTLR